MLAKTGTTEDVLVAPEQEEERNVETKISEAIESQTKVHMEVEAKILSKDSTESKSDMRQTQAMEELTLVEVKQIAEPVEDTKAAPLKEEGITIDREKLKSEVLQQPKPETAEAKLPRSGERMAFSSESDSDAEIERLGIEMPVKIGVKKDKVEGVEEKTTTEVGEKDQTTDEKAAEVIKAVEEDSKTIEEESNVVEGKADADIVGMMGEEKVETETQVVLSKKAVERDASTDSVDEMMVVVMPPGRTREEVDSSEQMFDEVSAPRIVVTPTPAEEKIEEDEEDASNVAEPTAEEAEESLAEASLQFEATALDERTSRDEDEDLPTLTALASSLAKTGKMEEVEVDEEHGEGRIQKSAVDVMDERKVEQSLKEEEASHPTLTAMASSLAKTGATDDVRKTPEPSPEKENKDERWVEVVTEKEVTMHEDVLTITETRHEVQVAPCVLTETTKLEAKMETTGKPPLESHDAPVKQLSDEEQEESGLEIIEAMDSQVDQATAPDTSDRTDSLLKESGAMQGSFTSDRTLSEPTLEAEEVAEISHQTLLAAEVERVMPEVESKVRDAEEESETASVRTVEVKPEDEEDEFKEEPPEDEAVREQAKDELPLLTALSSALTKTSTTQKEESEQEAGEPEVVQFSPMLSWTTEQTGGESISDRFPATKFGAKPTVVTTTRHLVFEESTTSSSTSRTATTSSSERSGTQSSIESHTTTTSRSTDPSSVVATSSGKSSSPSGAGPTSASSPRASSAATTGSSKDVEMEEEKSAGAEEGSPRLSPRSDPGSHDLASSPKSEEAAPRSEEAEPLRKSASPPLRTRTTVLSSEESVQSLPSSPRRARKSAKMVTTSEHFSTDSDLSRSLEIVYNQPEEDARRKLSERYSHSSGDSDNGEGKLAKRKASVTRLSGGSRKASTSESAVTDQYELQHKRPDEAVSAHSPPPSKKEPSPTKIVHPAASAIVREQVSEDHLSPLLDVNVRTPEELDTSKYRIELAKAVSEITTTSPATAGEDGDAGKMGQGQSRQVPPGLVADSPPPGSSSFFGTPMFLHCWFSPHASCTIALYPEKSSKFSSTYFSRTYCTIAGVPACKVLFERLMAGCYNELVIVASIQILLHTLQLGTSGSCFPSMHLYINLHICCSCSNLILNNGWVPL